MQGNIVDVFRRYFTQRRHEREVLRALVETGLEMTPEKIGRSIALEACWVSFHLFSLCKRGYAIERIEKQPLRHLYRITESGRVKHEAIQKGGILSRIEVL